MVVILSDLTNNRITRSWVWIDFPIILGLHYVPFQGIVKSQVQRRFRLYLSKTIGRIVKVEWKKKMSATTAPLSALLCTSYFQDVSFPLLCIPQKKEMLAADAHLSFSSQLQPTALFWPSLSCLMGIISHQVVCREPAVLPSKGRSSLKGCSPPLTTVGTMGTGCYGVLAIVRGGRFPPVVRRGPKCDWPTPD